jgi:hypothetical protein
LIAALIAAALTLIALVVFFACAPEPAVAAVAVFIGVARALGLIALAIPWPALLLAEAALIAVAPESISFVHVFDLLRRFGYDGRPKPLCNADAMRMPPLSRREVSDGAQPGPMITRVDAVRPEPARILL